MPVIKSNIDQDKSAKEGREPQNPASMEQDKQDITVEEFRANVEMMNRLMAESVKDLEKGAKAKDKKKPPSDSIIDGNFLSAVFAVVFIMIVCVSIYAFYNLFVAILKKFPLRHEEL